MKLRLPRRRIWRAAIYLFCLLLVLIAIDLILVEMRRTIHPGYDTTRIVGPLQADGSIDYLLALDEHFGQGVTPENNAAPLLLAALGRVALASNQPADGITGRLGMPHLPEQGDYFVQYITFSRAHNAGDESDPAQLIHADTWPLKIDPLTSQWIKENAGPLALIEEASKRPRLFIPFYGGNRPQTLVEILLPQLMPLRSASVGLLARAIIKLDAGDAAGFRDDVLAARRLARLLGQGPTIIERLVAGAMEANACKVVRLAAASGKLSAEQLRMLAAEGESLSELPSIAECINFGERFMVLDILQSMARMGPARAAVLLLAISGPVPESATPGLSVADFAPLMRLVPIPYEQAMREMNHYYDGALAAIGQRASPQRLEALRLWEAQIKRIATANPLTTLLSGDWLAQLLLPPLFRAQERMDATRVDGRLTQLALALAAFKADHNAYPATLAELSPTYLRSLPNDLFTEKPLLYSRTAGGYILRSVGPNMIDDAQNANDAKTEPPVDDIVVHVP